MTREEMIAEAWRLSPEGMTAALEGGEDILLVALETFYGHGVPDEQAGNADGPMGHVYRVDRWLVETDSAGNHEVRELESVDLARETFRMFASMA